MLTIILVLSLAQPRTIKVQQEGAEIGGAWVHTVNCSGEGITCTRDATAGVATLTVTLQLTDGGMLGRDAPVDGGYLTVTPGSTGSTNERVLTGAAPYVWLDAGASAVSINWSPGTTCSVGSAITTAADGGDLECTDVVTNANRLVADPADCDAGQFATAIDAYGVLMCSAITGADTGFQTSAALALYVDTTGNDSNACTDAGIGACLTIQGAVNRLPKFINHEVTISVAAGAYGAFNLTSGNEILGGVTVNITGTMSTASLDAGTASGTITSVTSGSSAGPATVADNTQAWTADALAGSLILFTSGPYNNTSYPISANTATSVTIPLSTNSAAAGNTYNIVTPGSTFNTTSASTIRGPQGGGALAISNIAVRRTGSTALSILGGRARIDLFSSDIQSTTGAGVSANGNLFNYRLFVSAASHGAQYSGGTAVPASSIATFNNVLVSSGGAALYVFNLYSGPPHVTASDTIASASGTGVVPVVSLARSSGAQNPALWVTCTDSAGVGIGSAPISITASAPDFAFSSNGSTRVTGCGVGIQVQGKGSITLNAPAFDTCTTALEVLKGGRIDFVTTTPTFTAVANELGVDGAFYAFSFLNALPTPQVISNSLGSTFVR